MDDKIFCPYFFLYVCICNVEILVSKCRLKKSLGVQLLRSTIISLWRVDSFIMTKIEKNTQRKKRPFSLEDHRRVRNLNLF